MRYGVGFPANTRNVAAESLVPFSRFRPLFFWMLKPCFSMLQRTRPGWRGRIHCFGGAESRSAKRKCVFPPGRFPQTSKHVLRGLNPERSYHVRFKHAEKDQTATGHALAEGINLTISERPGAELVYIDPETSPH
jgi:hypothetical protein